MESSVWRGGIMIMILPPMVVITMSPPQPATSTVRVLITNSSEEKQTNKQTKERKKDRNIQSHQQRETMETLWMDFVPDIVGKLKHPFPSKLRWLNRKPHNKHLLAFASSMIVSFPSANILVFSKRRQLNISGFDF
jgi:hypothetical protein